MHVSLVKLLGAALLAAMTAGCSLRSDVPLIAHSDTPDVPVEGVYQALNPMPLSDLRRVPEAARRRCADPGYSVPLLDKKDRPTGKRLRIVYCGYDPKEKKWQPMIRIDRRGGEYRWKDSDSEGTLRFQRRQDGVYLVQRDDSTPDDPSFEYALYRSRNSDLEIYFLACNERHFANVRAANDARGSSLCTITSLDEVQPELDRYASRVQAAEEFPMVLLMRIEPAAP